MVFEVLAVVLLVWVLVRARRHRGTVLDPSLMPVADRPPLESDEPMPGRRQLRRYAGDGLADIEDFLAGRDQTA